MNSSSSESSTTSTARQTHENSNAKTRGSPSLLSACSRLTLKCITSSPSLFVTTFDALTLEEREIVMAKVAREIASLEKIRSSWDGVNRTMPATDLQIHRTRSQTIPSEGDAPEDVQLREHAMATEVANSWIWIRPNERRPARKCIITWTTYVLSSKGPEAPLEICENHGYGRCSCFGIDSDRHPFFSRISSQLLLYRLCALFGMPPARECDGYKSCWEAALKYVGNNTSSESAGEAETEIETDVGVEVDAEDGISYLDFQDSKGSANVRFAGTASHSVKALELVNFLVSSTCPHTYDELIAGRRA